MPKTRALLTALTLTVGIAAAAWTAPHVVGDDPAPRLSLATTATADVTDGKAYAAEAIENLRVEGTFRFTQELSGPTEAQDLKVGKVVGAVELARTPNEEPRYHSKLRLGTPQGQDVDLESVAIGEQVHVKGPKQAEYRLSSQKAKKSKGKGAGDSGQVDVVDPVLQLLETVDNLPAAHFAAPSEIDAAGQRTVTVTLPDSASLVLLVDDASRQIARMTFTHGDRTVDYLLDGVGTDVGVPDLS